MFHFCQDIFLNPTHQTFNQEANRKTLNLCVRNEPSQVCELTINHLSGKKTFDKCSVKKDCVFARIWPYSISHDAGIMI